MRWLTFISAAGSKDAVAASEANKSSGLCQQSSNRKYQLTVFVGTSSSLFELISEPDQSRNYALVSTGDRYRASPLSSKRDNIPSRIADKPGLKQR